MELKLTHKIRHFTRTIINSYSIILFSQNIILGTIILLVTFINPVGGLCGIISVISADLFSNFLGLDKKEIESGLYSFNAIFIGIGIGTHYCLNIQLLLISVAASILSVLICLMLKNVFYKYGIPFLSIPFCIVSWMALLSFSDLSYLYPDNNHFNWFQKYLSTHISEKFVTWLFSWEKGNPSGSLSIYFRSFSSLFFSDSIIVGIVISLGLLIHSRIAFSLSIIGIMAAMACHAVFGISLFAPNINIFWCNYILSSIAIGSFFLVPSKKSYLAALLSIPLNMLIMLSASKLLGIIPVPMFFLPFCITIIIFLFAFYQLNHSKLIGIPYYQNYSPEANLYNYANDNERFRSSSTLSFGLPFIGEWYVSQGYNGQLTHKGNWAYAIDFIIMDEEMKTYGTSFPIHAADFYCYSKPVIAVEDGIVVHIADNIEDNLPGDVNSEVNWGNSITIKHGEGIYSKLSHLKRNSFRVNEGDLVKKGDVLALCGNSGRSPEPHIHFQLQNLSSPHAKTLNYPLSNFLSKDHKKISFINSGVPEEGNFVKNIDVSQVLKSAFKIQPSYKVRAEYKGKKSVRSENWEAFIDSYNNNFLYCSETDSYAYFYQTDLLFLFTKYYGKKDTLLYYFRLAAHKIVLSELEVITIKDFYPANLERNFILGTLQDFVAPFYRFLKTEYHLNYKLNENVGVNSIVLESEMLSSFFFKNKERMKFRIVIENGKTTEFVVIKHDKTLHVTISNDN